MEVHVSSAIDQPQFLAASHSGEHRLRFRHSRVAVLRPGKDEHRAADVWQMVDGAQRRWGDAETRLQLNQEQSRGQRRKRTQFGSHAIVNGITDVGVDRFDHEGIDAQGRRHGRRRATQRNTDDPDGLIRVFAPRETNCGAGIVLLKVSGRDRVPRTLAVGLKVDHHRRVSGSVKHSRALQHAQSGPTHAMQEHDHSIAVFGPGVPAMDGGSRVAGDGERGRIQLTRWVANRLRFRCDKGPRNGPRGDQPSYDQAQAHDQRDAECAFPSSEWHGRQVSLFSQRGGVRLAGWSGEAGHPAKPPEGFGETGLPDSVRG